MENFLPPTTKRVAYHTCGCVNEDIRERTLCRISLNKDCTKSELSDRIDNLEYEWDIERCLEAKAASIVLLSSIMGFSKRRCRWFLLTGSVGFFLLQHAMFGWCPPLPVLRKLGVRTAEEINAEKAVYKKLRGDFSGEADDADSLLEMAED